MDQITEKQFIYELLVEMCMRYWILLLLITGCAGTINHTILEDGHSTINITAELPEESGITCEDFYRETTWRFPDCNITGNTLYVYGEKQIPQEYYTNEWSVTGTTIRYHPYYIFTLLKTEMYDFTESSLEYNVTMPRGEESNQVLLSDIKEEDMMETHTSYVWVYTGAGIVLVVIIILGVLTRVKKPQPQLQNPEDVLTATKQALQEGDKDSAQELYAHLREMYDALPKDDQARYARELNEIYKKL